MPLAPTEERRHAILPVSENGHALSISTTEPAFFRVGAGNCGGVAGEYANACAGFQCGAVVTAAGDRTVNGTCHESLLRPANWGEAVLEH